MLNNSRVLILTTRTLTDILLAYFFCQSHYLGNLSLDQKDLAVSKIEPESRLCPTFLGKLVVKVH